ncbi:MAG: hypothetical protein Q9220_003721 [cf. Caloplaca sp. 1 TL-2023]
MEDSMRRIEERASGQKKRRRTSPSSIPQGSYRIPQRGQLQIIIKNPNKTAVKLFLVPYDLEGMESGTKTFIRQRCYSTDPVIDGISSELKSLSSSPFKIEPCKNKPILRYLVHINICSPSSGRFYLYQHIRVVFANRVPDNKEQLQTEVQIPQPRYSPYNPNVSLSRSISSSKTKLARDMAQRKRTSDFGVGYEGTDDRHAQALGYGTSYPILFNSPPLPVPALPLKLFGGGPVESNMEPYKGVVDGTSRTRAAGDASLSPSPFQNTSSTSPTTAFAFPRLPINRTRRFGKSDIGLSRRAEERNADTESSSSAFQSPANDRASQRCCCQKGHGSSKPSHDGMDSAYDELSRDEPDWSGPTLTAGCGENNLGRRLRDLGLRRTPEHEDRYGV